MKLIKPSFLICAFLCAGSLTESGTVLAASPTDTLYQQADSMYNHGEFDKAALFYEYEGYRSENNIDRTRALLKKTNCLKQLNEIRSATQTLSRIRYEYLSDSLVYECRYETALCEYLSGNFNNAESQLLQLEFYVRDSMLTRNALFLHALVCNELTKWTEAESLIQKGIRQADLSGTEKAGYSELIHKLYYAEKLPRIRSQQKAQILSMFLPGLGHCYAGYPIEGTTSFLFNAATIGFIVYNVVTHYYITTFAIATTFFQMSYVGGMNRVEFLIDKHNYTVTRKFNDKVKLPVLELTAKTAGKER